MSVSKRERNTTAVWSTIEAACSASKSNGAGGSLAWVVANEKPPYL